MSMDEPNIEQPDEEYDEEADSDFDGQVSDVGSLSSSAEDEPGINRSTRPGKKQAVPRPQIEDLDSGDEVTIKEQQKSKRKHRRKDGERISSDDEHDSQWRAKTRSMRMQEQAEKSKPRTASVKTSTIDVNKIWEEMNKPGPLPPVRIEDQQDENSSAENTVSKSQTEQGSNQTTVSAAEEVITIKRTFKFAGEVHVEEKIVPKSSAEAKLWMSQQENKQSTHEDVVDGRQRPLRKISRFDPNYANLDAFRNHTILAQQGLFKGPKLNVVEKSKMDWASHVDAEGLQNELDVHAKAKDAYLNRMDFLGQVEHRKEDEARLARQKG